MKTIARRLGALASVLYLGVCPAQAAPVADLADGRTGAIQYTSITGTFYQLLTVPAALAPTVTITGTLKLPAGTTGKVPAMILAHHCNGITASVTNLGALINSLGIATFIPDSFTPRGYPNGVCTTGAVNHGSATADALYALKLLATHPRIDASRIGIIGQSYGGNVVFNTAFEEVRSRIIANSLKFAAHVVMYGGCDVRNWSPNMTGSPMLILSGGADDQATAAGCVDFAQVLRTQAHPAPQITATVYPDAPHAWDNAGGVTYNANSLNYSQCRFQFRLDTLQSSRYDTGALLNGDASSAYITSCRGTGASQGGHAAAKAASYADIGTFLTQHLKGSTAAGEYRSVIYKHSGKCQDVRGGDATNGADVIQWPCHGGNNQKLQLVDKGNGYYSLVYKHSGLCTDVFGGGTGAGQKVIQWPCHGGDNQLFSLEDRGGGYFSFRYKHSGQCIDVFGGGTADAANVIQWPCHGGDNQLFRFQQ